MKSVRLEVSSFSKLENTDDINIFEVREIKTYTYCYTNAYIFEKNILKKKSEFILFVNTNQFALN